MRNAAIAIGAFERGLVTPSPFDKYLLGDDSALTPEQLAGGKTFVTIGCASCHSGVAVGGSSFHKLGEKIPFDGLKDEGRFDVTKREGDKGKFKVPSLRNISETGPYFHDGSVKTLSEAVHLMAKHQLGKEASEQEVQEIVAFLGALKGDIPEGYIAQPELPASK